MFSISRNVIRCKRCTRVISRKLSDKSDSTAAAGEGEAEAEAEREWPRRVVSGIQPTGALHVGNYFGALRRCVRLQDQGEDVTFFVADLHSLTSPQSDSTAAAGEGEAEAEAEREWPRRVVSGIQPTGALHVGNYFGALRRCVRLQDQGEDVTFFVADLHSLTSPQDAGLSGRVAETLAMALAAGLDPDRATVFVQSHVPRHAELCWLLACLATQARLAHLPQYRERAAAAGAGATPLGLLLYPVLQAADVLLHAGTHVPVGRDQAQHLQLAAALARTFAHRHGRAFPEPRALLADDGGDRLLSLRDPTRKMSKSDPDPKSRVLLVDDEPTIARKIRKAVTDFTPHVTYEPETRPGVSNLVALHCLATDRLPEEAVEEAAGLTTAQYKGVVARALAEHLAPVRARSAAWLARPAALRAVAAHGAARARRRADAVWARAAALAGLR